MSDDEYQLEHRLRKMKAMTYSEQRQAKITKKIFDALASRAKQRLRKYDEYYNMILCLKSFKGFMEFAIIKRQEEKQMKNLQGLRETQLMDIRNAKEEQRVDRLTTDLISMRIAKNFRKFCREIKQKIMLRQQKKAKGPQQQKIKNPEPIPKIFPQQSAKRHVFAQTQAKIFKEDRSNIHLLESSRRSISSAGYLTQELQAKRKFAAIKALPPKQLINEAKQKPKQQSQVTQKEPFHRTQPTVNRNNGENKLKQMSIPLNEGFSHPIQSLISESPLNQSSPNISPSILPPSKRSSSSLQNQQSSHILQSKRDQILALLSQLKMAQILTLQGLIEQNTKSNKQQAHLIEKRHIKQSIAILEKIVMLA